MQKAIRFLMAMVIALAIFTTPLVKTSISNAIDRSGIWCPNPGGGQGGGGGG